MEFCNPLLKKGQLSTLIIILAGLLVALAILYIASERTPETEQPLKLPAEYVELGTSVQSCSLELLADGLFLVGRGGGYLEFPLGTGVLSTQMRESAYWFIEGESKARTKEQIAQEVETYIQNGFASCSPQIESRGYLPFNGTIIADVTIMDKEASAHIRVGPFIRNNQEYTFDNLIISTPTTLGEMVDFAEWFTKRAERSPEQFAVTDLMTDKFTAEAFAWNKYNYLITLSEGKQELSFAMGYRPPTETNHPPVVEPVQPQGVLVGRTARVTINAIDPEFDDITTFVQGDNTRITDEKVEFTPEAPGKYTIIIGARDDEGNMGYTFWEVNAI